MGEKANNKSKKQPQKKKILPRPLSIHVDMPKIVARQDETYRPVRQSNEAINQGYEKLKGKATTPKELAKISNIQENFNVRQGRHQQVVTRGYDTTKREKQQHKSEDIERKNRQRTLEQLSSDAPYSVTNNIENARRNQAQLQQDNRSNWERQQAQNMYDLNAWQQRYKYWQNIENTTRDMMFRPFMVTNYVRATGDSANGYDSWLGSFFDPNKHGMWVGPEGRAFQQNHPLVSGLLDLGVDVLGPKFIPKIGKSLKPITFKPTSLTSDSYNLSTLADRFKNSNWYNFYFGNKKPITITITEPGSNPITTRINNSWLVKDKVRRASSLLRYKKPGTTLTIDGLPGNMEVIEIPQQAMNIAKKTLLPRVKISNPNDYSRSSYMMNKMKKAVAIDKELLEASSNGSIDGFATVDPKLPNYFPIGAIKSNDGTISYFTWIHELRHKLQHMINLSLSQKNLLEKAYEGIPKGERASVNAELRSNLLKGMGDMPVEYQNLFLDQYAKNPEVVLDKLEFLNGYGQNYVQNIYKLKNSKDLTQTVQNMIDAMKYVPLVQNQNKALEKLPKEVINFRKIN